MSLRGGKLPAQFSLPQNPSESAKSFFSLAHNSPFSLPTKIASGDFHGAAIALFQAVQESLRLVRRTSDRRASGRRSFGVGEPWAELREAIFKGSSLKCIRKTLHSSVHPC